MKNKMMTEFSKENNIKLKDLEEAYRVYAKEKNIPKDIMSKLTDLNKRDGEPILDYMNRRKQLRSDINSFIELAYEEYGIEAIKVSEFAEKLNSKLDKSLSDLKKVSSKQIEAKRKKGFGMKSKFSALVKLKSENEKIIKDVEHIMDNMENYTEANQLTAEEAQDLYNKGSRIKDRAFGLDKGLSLDIQTQGEEIEYHHTKDSKLFRDYLDIKGITMRHKEAQQIASYLSKMPEVLRIDHLIIGRQVEEMKNHNSSVREIVGDRSVTQEEKYSKAKGKLSSIFSNKEKIEKSLVVAYRNIDKANENYKENVYDKVINRYNFAKNDLKKFKIDAEEVISDSKKSLEKMGKLEHQLVDKKLRNLEKDKEKDKGLEI